MQRKCLCFKYLQCFIVNPECPILPSYTRCYKFKHLELKVLDGDRKCEINGCGRPAVMICGEQQKFRFNFLLSWMPVPQCKRACCEEHIEVYYNV